MFGGCLGMLVGRLGSVRGMFGSVWGMYLAFRACCKYCSIYETMLYLFNIIFTFPSNVVLLQVPDVLM